MAGAVAKKVLTTEGFQLKAALDQASSPSYGQDAGVITGCGPKGIKITGTEDYFKAPSNGAVYVDFTNPESALKNCMRALETGHDLVIGTTGFSPSHLKDISDAVARHKRSAVLSPNFSVGVNVFWDVAVRTAQLLKGYDIEIIEAHHKMKKDAPSGTAKKAAELIAKTLNTDERAFVYGRQGGNCLRKAPNEEIGILAVRAGDIFGDHTILYAGNSERIELKHQLHSRDALASGCLIAIKWVNGRGDGKVHDMKDVLGL